MLQLGMVLVFPGACSSLECTSLSEALNLITVLFSVLHTPSVADIEIP
jgi:hypothetical protein